MLYRCIKPLWFTKLHKLKSLEGNTEAIKKRLDRDTRRASQEEIRIFSIYVLYRKLKNSKKKKSRKSERKIEKNQKEKIEKESRKNQEREKGTIMELQKGRPKDTAGRLEKRNSHL